MKSNCVLCLKAREVGLRQCAKLQYHDLQRLAVAVSQSPQVECLVKSFSLEKSTSFEQTCRLVYSLMHLAQ